MEDYSQKSIYMVVAYPGHTSIPEMIESNNGYSTYEDALDTATFYANAWGYVDNLFIVEAKPVSVYTREQGFVAINTKDDE